MQAFADRSGDRLDQGKCCQRRLILNLILYHIGALSINKISAFTDLGGRERNWLTNLFRLPSSKELVSELYEVESTGRLLPGADSVWRDTTKTSMVPSKFA